MVWSPDQGRTWHRIDPGVDLIPLGHEGSFESHICYGSKPIVTASGTIREYYFGGDGPHYGVRNSSLALAEFRPNGLAGIGAPRGWVTVVRGKTVPLNVTGPKLIVTADTAIPTNHEHQGVGYKVPTGSVSFSVADKQVHCVVNEQQRNVTDEAVPDCDLSHLVGGAPLSFQIEVNGGAMLYTIAFGE